MARLLHRLHLRYSPSIACAHAGQRFVADIKRGMDQADARAAELLASGLTPEELRAVMWQEMLADPGFQAMLAHAEGVARRSFPTLYEDDDEGEQERHG